MSYSFLHAPWYVCLVGPCLTQNIGITFSLGYNNKKLEVSPESLAHSVSDRSWSLSSRRGNQWQGPETIVSALISQGGSQGVYMGILGHNLFPTGVMFITPVSEYISGESSLHGFLVRQVWLFTSIRRA